jgi:hypothetical protein
MTTAIAGALGVVTAASGVGSQVFETWDDLAGFDSNQRLVIIVALIAGIAVVHATDLLSRAIATSRASRTAIVAVPKAIPGDLRLDDPNSFNVEGSVVAIRADGQLLFRRADNGKLIWSPEGMVNV